MDLEIITKKKGEKWVIDDLSSRNYYLVKKGDKIIVIVSITYCNITPSFITYYAETPYPGSIVYIAACESLKNESMAEAFLSMGASAYLGYDASVYNLDAEKHWQAFFKNLVDFHKTVMQSYDDIPDKTVEGSELEIATLLIDHNHKFDDKGIYDIGKLVLPKIKITAYPDFNDIFDLYIDSILIGGINYPETLNEPVDFFCYLKPGESRVMLKVLGIHYFCSCFLIFNGTTYEYVPPGSGYPSSMVYGRSYVIRIGVP